MNEVRLWGFIVNKTKDQKAILRYTHHTPPKVFVSFQLAVDKFIPRGDGTYNNVKDYLPLTAWGDLAKKISDRCITGTSVIVFGKLTHRKYTDQFKVERDIIEVKVESIKILSYPTGHKANYKDEDVIIRNGEEYELSSDLPEGLQ